MLFQRDFSPLFYFDLQGGKTHLDKFQNIKKLIYRS